MTFSATRSRLGGRLAVAQLVGTVAGSLIVTLLLAKWQDPSGNPSWAAVGWFLIAALLFGIPFYALAVLVLHAFTASILRRPIAWCAGLPASILGLSLLLPSPPGAIHWAAAIALCGVIAGGVFLVWQWLRPMTMPKQ